MAKIKLKGIHGPKFGQVFRLSYIILLVKNTWTNREARNMYFNNVETTPQRGLPVIRKMEGGWTLDKEAVIWLSTI